jgi:hypothetical protein
MMSNNADIQAIYDSDFRSPTLKLQRMLDILQYECEIKTLTIWTYFDSNYDIIKNVLNKDDLIAYMKLILPDKYFDIVYRCNMVFEFKHSNSNTNNIYITEHSFDPFSKNHIIPYTTSVIYTTSDSNIILSNFDKMKFILSWETKFSRITGSYFDTNYNLIKDINETDELYKYIRSYHFKDMYCIIYNYRYIHIFCLTSTGGIYLKLIKLDPFDNNSYNEYSCSHVDFPHMKFICHTTNTDLLKIYPRKQSLYAKLISVIKK